MDQYYRKLLNTHEGSLIMGDSRAGQGVEPDILNDTSFLPFYNFAFTIGHCPWGDPYNKLIKKKFSGKAYDSNRVFILSVSPWTLQGIEDNPFPEAKLFTGNLFLDLYNPNFEYLIRFYENPLLDPLFNAGSKNYVTMNGRNTVIKNEDSKPDIKKKHERLNEYTSWLKTKGGISEHRLKSLEELIGYLSNYGHVFLVRIPVGEVFEEMEKTHFAEFDSIIQSRFSEIPYLNYVSDKDKTAYEFTDGCHLTKNSGNDFTKHLRSSIIRIIENKTDGDTM